MVDETISEKCETLYNKLNTFVASVISRDVTPKISNLNTEVWGSDTQTGSSRIDTLNTTINNLDSSITTMESDINNVESDINNVESDVSNLQTSVNSLNTSIANLMGFTLVYSGASDKINVYSNGLFVYFTMQGTFTMSANADTNTGTIPSQYAPNVPITVSTHPSSNNNLVINDTGSLSYHNFTSSTSQTLRIGVVYPLKANLP